MFTRLSKKTGMRSILLNELDSNSIFRCFSYSILFCVSSKSECEIFRPQADRRDRDLDVSMSRDSSEFITYAIKGITYYNIKHGT